MAPLLSCGSRCTTNFQLKLRFDFMQMTPEVIKMLNSRVKAPIRCENGIKATKLYPTKRQVIHE
eukprot:1027578-Amorphochlora_amoeboformis.AAC.1